MTPALGGNDAAIVLPDVDVKTVAPQLFRSALLHNGPACAAIKRIYLHRDIYAAMANALVDLARSVKVGHGGDEGPQPGHVQSPEHCERLVELLDEARAEGLRFLAGGGVAEGKGFFVPPTLVDNPPDEARILREEVFGPVCSLLRFSDVDDAIVRANDSPYRLGASVWSSDLAQARDVAQRLEAGTVWINEAGILPTGTAT